jgi:hypothetical protein
VTGVKQRLSRKAYASTQSIEMEPALHGFDQRSDPDALLRMLHQYFRVAERCAGGLASIRWSANRPRFVLVWPTVPIIGMGEPTFEQTPARRAVRVAILGGVVASPRSRASLSIAFTRWRDSLWASVELRDYMPRAGQVAVIDWLYRQTQLRVHEWVGLRYVRRLRQRWLARTIGG